MRYSVALVLLLFGFSLSFGQNDSSKTSTVTVIYSKVGVKKERESSIYNLIKINPLLILNGDIPIYYERRIADQFSVEGAVGFTYTDYLYSGFVLADAYGYEEERQYKPGYSLMASAKFYPSNYSKALDEFYFGVEIRHRRYNSEVEDCENITISGWVSEHRSLTDFKFTGGYISYLSDRVIADIYAGIGMRKRDYHFAYCDGTASTSMTHVRKNDIVPVISAGVKLGFAF